MPERGLARRIVMCSARGSCSPQSGAANTVIAAEVGVHVDTVRKWRRRFARDRIGRAGRPAAQSGRRREFTPVQVAEVKALACTLPAETGVAVVALVQR